MNKNKILLVGWDGADWKVINRLVEENKMPTIARLIEHGTIGNISTLDPPFSPMLWTTIATGMYPFKHGVLGFTEPRKNMQGVQPISSLSRKVKAIWNILTQNNLLSNIVNWWPSHPAEPINGFMVSNFFKAINDYQFHPLPKGAVHPQEFTEFFNHLRLLVPEISGEMLLPLLPNARQLIEKEQKRVSGITENLATTLSVHNIATWLLENTSWDFMAVYYDMIDHMSHGFMQFYPPRLPHINTKDFENYKLVVEGTYILHDYMLSTLLDLAGNDVNLILLSDHGFHSDHLRPILVPSEPAGPAYQHRQYGILLMHGPLFKQDERIYGASLLDITPTILYAYGLPIGQDMDGVPLVNAFKKPLEIKTIQSWEKLQGHSGQHPGDAKISNYDQAETLQQLIDLGYIEKPDADGFKAAQKSQTELNYNLARSYMFAHYFDKAAQILASLFSQAPHDTRFATRLIKCYLNMDEISQAKNVFTKYQKSLDIHKNELKEKLLKLREELKKHSNGKTEEIDKLKEQFAHLVRQYKNAEKDLLLMPYLEIDLLIRDNQIERSLDNILKIKNITKPNPEIYKKIADLYFIKQDYQQAINYLEKAIELDPENYQSLYKLGLTYYKIKNYELAIEYLLQSVSLVYYNYQAQYVLALAFNEVRDYQRAALALEVTLLIAPNFIKARQLLVKIYKDHLHNLEKAQYHESYFESPSNFFIHTGEIITQEPQELRVKPDKKIILSENKNTIIIVSGLPRSGTSLMMQILKNAGIELFTDGHRQKDQNNPRGYYEHQAVKRIAQDNSFLENLDNKAVKIVSHLLPFLPDKHNYKIIFMERDMDEIVRSQLKMIEHSTGEKKEYRYFLVKNNLTLHLNRIKNWLSHRTNIDILFINFNQLIENPIRDLKRITTFLGLPDTKINNMAQTVDKNLYRTRKSKKS